MMGGTPRSLQGENDRLAKKWLGTDENIELSEFIGKYASDALKAYRDKLYEHIDNMNAQGIMI